MDVSALQLKRPLVIFDLETTGTDLSKDRIVEIAMIKVNPDGTVEKKPEQRGAEHRLLINPGMPIPAEATAVHGITNEKVANAPVFKEIAAEIYTWFKGSDLAGYNSDRFDIPLLAEEMLRAGIDVDFKKHKAVDVQTIFHKMEQRTLTAAYRFYCDKDLDNAHSASADTKATFEVLKSQIERYDDLENDVDMLSQFTTRHNSLDFAGYIRTNKEN